MIVTHVSLDLDALVGVWKAASLLGPSIMADEAIRMAEKELNV